MAQIAVAWNLKGITAPIVGTAEVRGLKEMIGEWHDIRGVPPGVLIVTVEAPDVESIEEVEYLVEPYLPNIVLA